MLQFPRLCDSRPKKSCKGKHWIVEHSRTILMDSTPRFEKRWISICSNTVLWRCVSKQNQHFPIDIEVTVRSTGRTKSLRFEENAFVREDPIRRRSIGKAGMRMRVEFKHKEIMSRRHTNRCALKPKGAKYLSVTRYSNREHQIVVNFLQKKAPHPSNNKAASLLFPQEAYRNQTLKPTGEISEMTLDEASIHFASVPGFRKLVSEAESASLYAASL